MFYDPEALVEPRCQLGLLAAEAGLPKLKATVGLDGFVDEIIAVVDKRKSHDAYEPIRTIDALGKRVNEPLVLTRPITAAVALVNHRRPSLARATRRL